MGFSKSQGTCTGRGFSDVDSDGFLKNLHDFITAHADWSIIRDRSTYPTQKTCTNADGATEIITCASHDLYSGEIVRFQDLGSGVPSGISTTTDYVVKRINANTFYVAQTRYNLQAGSYLNIGNLAANFGVTRQEPYILASDDGTPSDRNDLKNMVKCYYHLQDPGYIRMQMVASYDPSEYEIVFVWSGYRIATLDAAAFIFDFRANDEGLFYIQSQISGTWRGCGVDEFAPLSNYLESPDTIIGTTQNSLSNGSDVVVQLTDSAEANLFTSGEFYYIYDFRYDGVIPRIAVGYGQCNGVGVADGLNADEIQFATLNNDFNAGAKVSPYPIPLYSISNGSAQANDIAYGTSVSQLPFYSRQDGTTGHYCIDDQGTYSGYIYGNLIISRDFNAIIKNAPDDKGNYTVQRPLLCENSRPNDAGTTTDMNRAYGESKNIYLSDDDGLSIMTTGRTINGKEYINVADEDDMFYGGNAALAVLMLNEA